MAFPFYKYEIPLLQAMQKAGGQAKAGELIKQVGEWAKREGIFRDNPEELKLYAESGQIRWKNKVRWARQYLKQKGQLDGSVPRLWKITTAGQDRLVAFEKTRRDPDEGLAALHGISDVTEQEEQSEEPEKVLKRKTKETGGLLGVKGIVYEPINEQGTILLFAALAEDLHFMIEAIGAEFPDAHLRRLKPNDRWEPIRAEFEFRASSFRDHKHNSKECDLIICWENDWPNAPIEVLELKQWLIKAGYI